jgi:hypothetical protein
MDRLRFRRTGRPVLGIEIASGALRAVLLHRGVMCWHGQLDPWDGESLPDALNRLLASAPRTRFGRWTTVVALGPSRSQLRRISGLPHTTDARLLERVIAGDPGAYFVRNGVPLLTSRVRAESAGIAWAAAVETSEAAAIVHGCRRAGLRLRAIVPAAAVLARLVGEGKHAWVDGRLIATVTASDGVITALRRRLSAGENESAGDPLSSLPAGFPATCARAYAAAAFGMTEPVALDPVAGASVAGPVSRARSGSAIAALAATLIWALLSPALAANFQARQAELELAALASARHDALTERRAVEEREKAHAALDRFYHERTGTIALLAELTAALPSGVAIVQLDLMPPAGTMVVLGPSASALLSALERSTRIATPEVVGPITRERIGESEAERLTVRFRIVSDVGTRGART